MKVEGGSHRVNAVLMQRLVDVSRSLLNNGFSPNMTAGIVKEYCTLWALTAKGYGDTFAILHLSPYTLKKTFLLRMSEYDEEVNNPACIIKII